MPAIPIDHLNLVMVIGPLEGGQDLLGDVVLFLKMGIQWDFTKRGDRHGEKTNCHTILSHERWLF